MVLKDCSSADPDEVGFSSKRLSQHHTSNGVLISCADMSEEYLRYPRTPLEPIACRPCNEASAVSHPCTAYLASKMARRRECLIRETEWKHTHSTQRVEARCCIAWPSCLRESSSAGIHWATTHCMLAWSVKMTCEYGFRGIYTRCEYSHTF